MNIEFKIADSYLNIGDDYWDELGAFYAENVWKLAPDECTKRVKLCFSSFEYEFAVKWYEISAMSKGKLVGFMRAMRDPDDDTRWRWMTLQSWGQKYYMNYDEWVDNQGGTVWDKLIIIEKHR